ncbi:MAG: thioredoxin-disulfide reductase [Clostridia bacterium]|nr:thioredoxin-disulfide reductase [Clostridia bacterium]
MYDIIIVGGGPAGMTAAIYALRARKKVLMIEKLVVGGQVAITSLIENYPGFESITGQDLSEKMFAQANKYGLETVYADVVDYDLKGEIKKVVTHEGTFEGKSVILALGASARTLDVASEKEFAGRGISYCASCDGNFYKDKVVAVVGGGNSSLGAVLYLVNLAKKVYLIHRRETFKAEEVQIQKVMNLTKEKDAKVEFIPNATIQDLEGNGKVESMIVEDLKTGATKEIAIDGVFVAIGRRPDTGFLQGMINLDEGGHIITDENMKTNIDGVYAAGDVRSGSLKQIVTAAADGAIAASRIVAYLNQR